MYTVRYCYNARVSFRMFFVRRLCYVLDGKKAENFLGGGGEGGGWNNNVLGGKISKN